LIGAGRRRRSNLTLPRRIGDLAPARADPLDLVPGQGTGLSKAAFCSHRSGRVVPTIAVWTPGVPRVKRSAVATAASGPDFKKS